jgi:hypothetical protein
MIGDRNFLSGPGPAGPSGPQFGTLVLAAGNEISPCSLPTAPV